jgi:glycerol-3-phosphate dehydrogenase (NAD(P)+)
MAEIAVIGAGSWGTALAVLLSNNGHKVTVWYHSNKAEIEGVTIPDDIRYTQDPGCAADADIVVMAVSSTHVRATAVQFCSYIHSGQIIVDVAKGIEEGTQLRLSEIIEQEIPQADVAVLSGPSHAEEVGRGIPTTIVVGAHTEKTAKYVQDIFMSDVFRVYISPDILGIETGAALKNVVALAAGMADGLGYGDNTKAALITRGIAEISRLGMAMGGKPETFYGLTGIGDLIVTCASMHSRNRRAGILIGQGKSVQEAMEEVKQVVEGVYSTKAAMQLSQKYKVELPIIEQVNEILFNGKAPDEAVRDLMLRDRKIENPLIPFTE